MSFFGSIILLLSVVFFVALPYGVGHGLAAHDTTAIIIGVICGIIGIALFMVQKMFARGGEHSR